MSHVLKEPLIGYKKGSYNGKQAIVTLQIPTGASIRARRTSLDKNRASAALVLAVTDYTGAVDYPHALPYMQTYRDGTKYVPGVLVVPKNGFAKNKHQCDSGIHFYRRFGDAQNH